MVIPCLRENGPQKRLVVVSNKRSHLFQSIRLCAGVDVPHSGEQAAVPVVDVLLVAGHQQHLGPGEGQLEEEDKERERSGRGEGQ